MRQTHRGDGIQVLRDSHADIAGNTTSGNGGDGIEVSENSTVQLGEDTGATIFESPNSGSGSGNTGNGVKCTNGGLGDGVLGSLTGNSGAKSFPVGCTDSIQ